VVELDDAPEYEALSYVWGDTSRTRRTMAWYGNDIEINGHDIDVTFNLERILRRVRHVDRIRTLWVDAICIDQSNIDERGHQVAFMGLIFEHARTVLICIGDCISSDRISGERVAELIKESEERISNYDSIESMPILSLNSKDIDAVQLNSWGSLSRLLDNDWFSRVWVVQEVGLAKNPVVLFGNVEFGYRALMRLTAWISRYAISRCALQLKECHFMHFHTIHTAWSDWLREEKISAKRGRTPFWMC
jgi:hypothetical protein